MTLTSDRPWLASYATGVPAVIEVPDEPLTAGLARTVARHPDRVALVFEGKTTTYRELAREIDRAAGALHGLGVRAGDRVAIALPNCHTHVVAFWAVLRLGAVVVEHNPTYAAAELEHQLADSGAVVAIGWEPTAARIVEVQARTAVRSVLAVDLTRDLPAIKRFALSLPVAKARTLRSELRGDPGPTALDWHRVVARATPLPQSHPQAVADDIALIQYTGGTTGTPKGAVVTHRSLVANVLQSNAWAPLRDGEETTFGALPFFHAFGLTLCLLFAAHVGATLIAFGKFDPEAILKAQRRRPATFMPGVAPMFDRLARLAEERHADLSSIRIAFAGAMPISKAAADRWERLTGGLLIEGYGMTETAPIALGNPCSADRRPLPTPRSSALDDLHDVPTQAARRRPLFALSTTRVVRCAGSCSPGVGRRRFCLRRAAIGVVADDTIDGLVDAAGVPGRHDCRRVDACRSVDRAVVDDDHTCIHVERT